MQTKHRRSHLVFAVILILLLSSPQAAFSYSVLTHEAIIDSTCDASIKPLLLQRFPAATPEQLREARAHAYGGAIIQDMGYYPFGSKLFTDLAHYVRSGDFIAALISEAQDVNEYAFALGALAHYAADNEGHSIGVNHAVPLMYPKLRERYGPEITYAQDPPSHLKTEFGFDVVQVARGRYAPETFHDFIGFKVAEPVLERAFKKTYGLEMKDLFLNLDLALGSYRYSVSSLIPEMTKVAWETKKDEIAKEFPGVTREKFVYRMSRATYHKEWGKQYQKPGLGARMLAFVIRILPKVGPLKAFTFKPPTPEAEKRLLASLNNTLERYRTLLGDVKANRLILENRDFDTAKPTRAGEYPLADAAYAKLLVKLESHNFQTAPPELRANILAFYQNLDAPNDTKKNKNEWRGVLRALDKLKALQTARANVGTK